MGNYLGRLCPCPPPRVAGEQRRVYRAHRHALVCRWHLGRRHPYVQVPPLALRPRCRYGQSWPRRWVTASLRQCSRMPQTLCLWLGILTSMCRRRDHQKKEVMWAANSQICSSGSVWRNSSLCVAQDRLATPMPPTTPRAAQDTSLQHMVLRARGEDGNEMAKPEEDPTVLERQADQGRGPDGAGEAQSAFRPLRVWGCLSSFVPRPGPLQTILNVRSSGNARHRQSQTSVLSFCRQRNTITSSYSSTRGFQPLRRRETDPATGHARLPQGSSETVSQEGPQAPSSAPAFSQRRSQPGENQDANCGQRQPPRKRSPSHASDGSGPRKRKYPLLPRRRGEPLSLPPPPEPGFRVTDKDLDAEKRAVLQRINRALRGETEATSGCGAAEAGKADLSAGPPKPSAHAPSSAPVQGCAKGSPTAAGPTPAAAGASPNTSILKPTWGPPQNGGQGGPLQSQSKASRISAARGASSAFPAGPSKSRMEAPVPMQVDSPVSSQAPTPGAVSSAHPSTSLPILPAVSAGPSTSTSAGLAPQPTSDSTVTPMDTSPPSRAVTSGAPSGSSGSVLPSATSLPILPAVSAGPSTSTSAGSAPQPTSDSTVTPMDTSPPSWAVTLGAPPGSSGSVLPSAQALQTPSRGSTALGAGASSLPALSLRSHTATSKLPLNPGATAQTAVRAPSGQQQGANTSATSVQGGKWAAPAPAQATTSAPGQPALGSTTQGTLGGPSRTTSTLGTHAHTWPALPANLAVGPSGTATASSFAAATQVPSAVTKAGTKVRQHRPKLGSSTSSAHLGLGHLAAPVGPGSGAGSSDLVSAFAGLSMTDRTSGAPSTTQRPGGSLSRNTRKRKRSPASTPTATTGSSTSTYPVSGGTTAPTLGPTRGGASRKRPHPSSPSRQGRSTTASAAASSGAAVSASTSSSPAAAVGTAKKRLAVRDPSSSGQGSGGHKTHRPPKH